MSLLKNTMDWNHVRVQTDVQLSQVIVGVPCDLHKGGEDIFRKREVTGWRKAPGFTSIVEFVQVSVNEYIDTELVFFISK